MPVGHVDKAIRNSEILQKFYDETGVTRTSDGSNAKALHDAIVDRIEAVERRQEDSHSDMFPMTASGPYLELWMQWADLEAKLSSKAYSLEEDQVVRFVPGDGAATFGDLNDGNPITLLRGSTTITGATKFSTNRGFEEFDVEYDLLEDYVLQPGDSEQWIGVIALESGTEFNISAGQLRNHSFSGYSTYPERKLIIENVSPIASGETDEEESQIRYRLSRNATSRTRSFGERIAARLDTIPGVSDVIFFAGYSGAGSIDFYLDSQSFEVAESTLEDARELAEENNSFGAIINVDAVERVGIYVELGVSFKPSTSSEVKDAILEAMRTNIYNQVLALNSGDSLDLAALYRSLIITFVPVASIGIENQYFDKVILYRGGLLGQRLGEQLDRETSLISVGEVERLLPEVSFADPIIVREV